MRYGDAIALLASLQADTATLTGAKSIGFSYPIAWHEFVKMCTNPNIDESLRPIQHKTNGVSDDDWEEASNQIRDEIIFSE